MFPHSSKGWHCPLCLSLRPVEAVGLDARLGSVGIIPRAMGTGHWMIGALVSSDGRVFKGQGEQGLGAGSLDSA